MSFSSCLRDEELVRRTVPQGPIDVSRGGFIPRNRGTHMIAATPEISLGCEFYQASYFLEEDILEEPFCIENGQVIVPQGVGLGGKPDISKLKHYAINHSLQKTT